MAPELYTSLEVDELRQLAARIEEYREAHKLSFGQLQKKFPGIGSDRTWGRIRKGELSELDLEQQLANYRTVCAVIESLGEEDQEEEQLFEDLSPAIHLRRAAVEAMRENGNARVVLMEGPTGTGKTASRKLLQQRFGQRFICIEATEVWGDSPLALLGAILTALGTKEQPYVATMRLSIVLEKLNANRTGIIIEEAHHLGKRTLNTCKTIINQSPGEIILLAYPNLWANLEREAYFECKQLVGNRLARRIKVHPIKESDVAKLIKSRLNLNGSTEQAVRLLMPHTTRHANFAFVRETIKKARAIAGDGQLTLEQFGAAINEEILARNG